VINLNIAKNVITKSFGRGSLVLSKYSPEILMGVGIIGVVVSTVLACKATLKVDRVMKETQKDLDKIHKTKEYLDGQPPLIGEPGYSDADYAQELALVHVQRIVSIGRLYALPIALGSLSIGCLVGSHNILSKRNVALMSAYKLIDESYKAYRQRVSDELGADKELDFRRGITKEIVTEVGKDKKGKEIETQKAIIRYDPEKHSDYARWFDDLNPLWRGDPEYNDVLLRAQESFANDLLHSRGHLFLNEVYDMLCIPRLFPAGQIMGWVNNGDGDNYVDFGLAKAYHLLPKDELKCIYGKRSDSCAYFLDFNVDGVIFDQI
jgi:hypothetical protein